MLIVKTINLIFLFVASFSIFYTATDMYNILFDNKPIEEEIVIMQYLIDEDFGEDALTTF